ncbi:hypothetical protein ACIBCM_10480 [Streptomyces sp. NPDC051018]|uniref:hypothetical protein n=1 Tax=Streptomyces sp. NPDC051018 TaxID=3365639 RepID=UPI0037BA9433
MRWPATGPGVPGEIVRYSVYLEYTDDLKDSVPTYIQTEADGSNGFRLGTTLLNPDHADRLQRRLPGIQ